MRNVNVKAHSNGGKKSPSWKKVDIEDANLLQDIGGFISLETLEDAEFISTEDTNEPDPTNGIVGG
jgi:hypothetical protein